MNITWRKGPILIFIAALLLYIGIGLIRWYINQDPKDSVVYEYDEQKGIVTFNVDPNYELYDIQLNYGRVELPQYDSDTKTILFDVFELESGKNEFFTFRCNKKTDNKVVASDSVTYEVIRGGSEITIIRYKFNMQRESKRYKIIYNRSDST